MQLHREIDGSSPVQFGRERPSSADEEDDQLTEIDARPLSDAVEINKMVDSSDVRETWNTSISRQSAIVIENTGEHVTLEACEEQVYERHLRNGLIRR